MVETLLAWVRKTFQGAQTPRSHAVAFAGREPGKNIRDSKVTDGAVALHRHIFFHPDCDAEADANTRPRAEPSASAFHRIC